MSHRSITGKHISRKTGTIHPFESALERDWLIVLEFDTEVEYYTTQPVTIHYLNNEEPARYTPDVIVYYKDELKKKPLLCEVKYEAELIEKADYYAPKFNAAHQYARNNGYLFETVTEKQIRTVYLENIKLLSRYYHAAINEGNAEVIHETLKKASFLSINEVVGIDQEHRSQLLYAVWQLLAGKRIGCDMNNKITMETLIWNL
jgi:hypothetical protein